MSWPSLLCRFRTLGFACRLPKKIPPKFRNIKHFFLNENTLLSADIWAVIDYCVYVSCILLISLTQHLQATAGYTLDKLTVHRRADIQRQTNCAVGYFRVISSSNPQFTCFGLWEEAGVLRENLCRHRENMQTAHDLVPIYRMAAPEGAHLKRCMQYNNVYLQRRAWWGQLFDRLCHLDKIILNTWISGEVEDTHSKIMITTHCHLWLTCQRVFTAFT